MKEEDRRETIAWLLLLLGSLLGIAGAGLFVGVVIGLTAEACCSPHHYGRDWNFWWFTAVVELQAALAAWILWSVFERSPRPMLRDLSVVFVGSSICSYFWHYLLASAGGGLMVVGSLLYLAAGLAVASSLLLSSDSARLGKDGP
jgi:drug/metabolite transporter (DMT)-like permease